MQFVDDVDFKPKTREYPKGPRGPRERSEAQKPWDAAFQRAMEGRGILHAQVKPNEADDARKAVKSAARYFERAVTEGEAQPGREKGTVILSWKIRVPEKRGPRAKKTAE